MVRALMVTGSPQGVVGGRESTPGEAAIPLPFLATLGLFVASGAAGLVDQVCFSKYLSYIVGSTAYAVSTVLAAFMMGLALGAHLGGRASLGLRRPLVAYGVIEVAAGLAVATTPFAFETLTELYAGVARRAPDSLGLLTALRWCVALVIVVVPTAAMGATLPVLTRVLGEARDRERRLGALYAANTAGGALGAVAGAYLLLPEFGLRSTLFGSAFVSVAVGCVALLVGRRMQPLDVATRPTAPRELDEVGTRRQREALGLGALAFLSGCLVFVAEVVFTHLLALLIGNSAYAFGLILAIFLVCLFAGAAAASWFSRSFGEAALGIGLAASALALAATLPLWDQLPRLFVGTGERVTSFAGREAVRAAAAFLAVSLPTMLMGLTFPLLLRRVASMNDPSRWVGRFTAVNTLGAVAGALGGGYLLLPALGSQRSLVAVALTFALAAALAARRTKQARTVLGIAGAAVLVGALAPRWDLARMTSGSNVYFAPWSPPEAIPFVREDVHGGVTTVTRDGDVFTLLTNGKFQGNTGWEMSAQRLFAHYPSLFVARFERALVIGLGTGTTLGTLAAYPWKRLDVVEISPAIVEAARRFFSTVNHRALDDPRVVQHHGDGRNFLLVDDGRYDLIGIELTSIWFAGASNLYSREFYRQVRDRLSDRGVFQQWVQLHHVRRRDFATIVQTLRGVFPHVALFYGGGQGILVASVQPLAASRVRLRALESLPALKSTLPDERRLPELLDDVLVTGGDLDAFLADSARREGVALEALVSTDHNLYLEYATPRGNVLPWATREALVRDIASFRREASVTALLTR